MDPRRELRDADSDFRIAKERRLEAMIRAAERGLTHKEIADELDLTRSAVSQMLRAPKRRKISSRGQ